LELFAKFIIVINNINVSRFDGDVPYCQDSRCRKISGGPIYSEDEVLLLAQEQRIQLWTRGSIVDAQKWSLDMDEIAEMIIHAIQKGVFKCSEWCIQKTDGPWAACDVYTFFWTSPITSLPRQKPIGFYLKFAISKAGQSLLTVSIHPQGA
jgi:hypothetical protein